MELRTTDLHTEDELRAKALALLNYLRGTNVQPATTA